MCTVFGLIAVAGRDGCHTVPVSRSPHPPVELTQNARRKTLPKARVWPILQLLVVDSFGATVACSTDTIDLFLFVKFSETIPYIPGRSLRQKGK